MKNSALNVAIIGCGRIAGHHCRSIEVIDRASMVAACDLNFEKAATFRDELGIKPYENYHTMLAENPQVNTVAIVTPSGMHFKHAAEIITRYKKNIIVEKPTFMRPSQVKEIYKLAAENGVDVFPVFQNRYNRAVERVRQGIVNDELGEIRTVAVRVRWCRPQRYYDLAPWRGTFAMDGGALTNQGIHHLDLMRKLGGEISRVCSSHKTFGAEIEVEDTATAVVEFESGAIGVVEVTTSARPDDYEASLSLVCEKGLAQIGGIAVNELQTYTPDPDACGANSENFDGNVYGHGHTKMYEQITNFMVDGGKPPVDFEDTLRTIQLLNAFYVSDEANGWTNVSEAGDSARLGQQDADLAALYTTPLN